MPTANEDYWNNFAFNEIDVERLYGYLLERGEPVPTHELALQVVEARLRDEQARRLRPSQESTLYQPKREYLPGQHLIFSSLDGAEAVVTAVRPSDNPRLPPFQVITVQFDGEAGTHEFASGYDLTHPLNEDRAKSSVTTDLSADQVLAQYRPRVEAALQSRLTREKEFVPQGGLWLLRGLLTEIHEGYLNVAEAAIEQANASVPTAELARTLEIKEEAGKKSTLLFSLEHALRHDPRFIDVGPTGEVRWFLSRAQPLEAREFPKILRMPPPPAPYLLPQELEAFVQDLEGAADVAGAPAPQSGPMPLVPVALTYPHRRMGTLPLTSAVRAILPETQNPSMMITLVDEAGGTRMPGWVVPQGNYLYGLGRWYDQRKLNPGAVIQLTKRSEPLTLGIMYEAQRERSLWVRAARVDAGRLTFMQLRKPIAHKYDEEMLFFIGDQAGIDSFHASARPDRPLETVLFEIFPELAKLVPGGRVHAKTLFAAVNFAQRVSPRAVFTALLQSPTFVSTGGGYFMMETARDLVR